MPTRFDAVALLAAVAVLASVSTAFANGVQTGGGFNPPGGDQGPGGGPGGGGGTQQPKSITAQQYMSFVSTYYQQFLNQGQTEQQALANAIQLAHNTFQTQLSINQPNGIQSFLQSVALALGGSPGDWNSLLRNGTLLNRGVAGDYGGEAGLGVMGLAGGAWMMTPQAIAPLEGVTSIQYRLVAGETYGGATAQGGEVAYMNVNTLTAQYATGAQRVFGTNFIYGWGTSSEVYGLTVQATAGLAGFGYATGWLYQNPRQANALVRILSGSDNLIGGTSHTQYDANGNLVTVDGPGPLVGNPPVSPWQSTAMGAQMIQGAYLPPPPITVGFVDQSMINGRYVPPGYNNNPTAAVERLAPNGVQLNTDQNGNTIGATYTYNSYGAGGVVLSQKTVNYDANGIQTSTTIVNSNGSTTTTYANGSAPMQTPPGTVNTSNWGPQSVPNPGSGSGGASADGVTTQQ